MGQVLLVFGCRFVFPADRVDEELLHPSHRSAESAEARLEPSDAPGILHTKTRYDSQGLIRPTSTGEAWRELDVPPTTSLAGLTADSSGGLPGRLIEPIIREDAVGCAESESCDVPLVRTVEKLSDGLFNEDLGDFIPRLTHDARGIFREDHVWLLGLTLAGSIGIHQGVDQAIRRDTARHESRWGKASQFLGTLGEPQVQVPLIVGLYALSLNGSDPKFRDFSTNVASATALNGLATVLVKVIANTSRPSTRWNSGRWGFPSWHISNTVAIAAIADDYYGHHIGVPLYVLTGLIGWSRIDERDHDLSDIVFGAALGFVVGRAVTIQNPPPNRRFTVSPWFEPGDGTSGLLVEARF